jgi:hypothetical protein
MILRFGAPNSATKFIFPVAAFFEKALTPAQWKAAFEKPPKPKMISLLEMIEQAKNRQTKES